MLKDLRFYLSVAGQVKAENRKKKTFFLAFQYLNELKYKINKVVKS